MFKAFYKIQSNSFDFKTKNGNVIFRYPTLGKSECDLGLAGIDVMDNVSEIVGDRTMEREWQLGYKIPFCVF